MSGGAAHTNCALYFDPTLIKGRCVSALRPIFVLIAAVWFLQLAGGALSVIVPLGLSEMGASATNIGIIAALYAAGMMAGAYGAPRLVGEIGNIRVFSAAASLTLIGSLALSFTPSIWLWAPIRIFQGIGFAAMFASAEAWLGQAAPKDQRGSVLGAYNVAAKAALMTGPFLIAGFAPLASGAFILTGIFLALALIPVCLTRQVEPQRVQTGGLEIRAIIKAAPSAVLGCFMAGIINTGTFALLPVFAASAMTDYSAVAAAATAFAVANAGGLIAQWPIGKLSDRLDRRTVVAAQTALAAIAVTPLAIFGSTLPSLAILALITAWGAGSLTFYGVCIAHGIDRVEEGRITELMGVLIISWATGSVIGPIIAGFVVESLPGQRPLFVFTLAGLILLSLSMIQRKVRRSSPRATRPWVMTWPAPIGLMSTKFYRIRRRHDDSGQHDGSGPG